MNFLKRRFCWLMLSFGLLCMGCDYRHRGAIYVENDSDHAILYVDSLYPAEYDTILVPAHSHTEVEQFGGLGPGYGIDCCPCEIPLKRLVMIDSTLVITKSFMHQVNWLMDNPNRKNSDRETVKCTFVVRNSDLMIVD